MIFVAAIATPANTSSTAPVVTPLPIVLGTITRVLIYFPPGQSGLAHCKILYGLYQLFPSDEQADFAGDDALITWDENIEIDADPAQLTIVTYNDDDTYTHTVTLHVVMQPATGALTANQTIAQIMSAETAAAAAGS